MKKASLPFDHRPDPVLRAALGHALTAEDHPAFVARVTAALTAPEPVHWDILAAWARHGIAVACLAGLSAALLVGTIQAAPLDLVASIAVPSARAAMVCGIPPDAAFLLVPMEAR